MNNLALTSSKSISNISKYSKTLIRDGITILVHGNSSVVKNVLINSARRGIKFNIILTESMPDNQGKNLQHYFEQNHI